jgi:dihydroorotase
MSTANPARAIGVESCIGSLRAGRGADISVLELVEGDWEVYDSVGATMRVHKALVPHLTVKGGRVFTPDFGPRPWGWLPDPSRPEPHAGHGCCG